MRGFAVDKDLRSTDEMLAIVREAGGRAVPYACDVTDFKAVAALVAACQASYGGVDILVNNVGGPSPGGPVKLSEQASDLQIALNLTSVFLMCKHAMPLMEGKGAGSLVNIASMSGIRWTGSAAVGYAVAEAGVIQFGRFVGVEYASKSIRINLVLPGQLHTPLLDKVLVNDQSDGDMLLQCQLWRCHPDRATRPGTVN